MTIVLRHLGGYVEAMGHRVPDGPGAAAELKRRCLATLARCSSPPDEVRFVGLAAVQPVAGPGPAKCQLRARG